MLAILCPSRGLTFTRTDILIDQVRDRFDSRVFRTYDKKIPDAHNWLVEEALKTDAEFLLFLEEDNVPTIKQVLGMVNRDVDICFIDYGVNGWSCSAKDKNTSEILWCGLGCTLIHRRVFEKLERPFFRTDKTLRLNDWKWLDQETKYGGHDIWFFTKVREAGFKITQIQGEVEHLGIKEFGKPEINNGLHNIFIKSKILREQIIERM